MYALKRRLICGSFLLLVILGSVVDLHGEHSGRTKLGPSLLGLASGLLLGVIHIPEAGVTRYVPSCVKLTLCGVVAVATVYMASYPWHDWPSFGPHRPLKKRWIHVVGLSFNAFIYILCILKKHPPSTYAHDAKWCMLGLWLSAMSLAFFQLVQASGAENLADCALAFAISLDSVVLGWVLIMFQARMRMLRDAKKGRCFECFEFWIYVMCGAFVANSVATVVQRGSSNQLGLLISVLFRSIFLIIWLVCVCVVCHALGRGLCVLWAESRRVKGLPKRQAQWAARVLRLELFICFTLGLTTFIVWSTINVVKFTELTHPEAYARLKLRCWFWVSVIRRFDGALNALELAFLSGILWQGNPPEEDGEMESRSRLRGLTSMSDFLEVDEQVLYRLKVKELAHRGVRLRSLLDFWDELLEGEVMPSFSPRRSQTNDVMRQAVIPKSRLESGGRALAVLWEEGLVPQAMVTHNWTNSFCNLLGGMIADALELDVYAPVAEQLASPSGCKGLRQQLKQRDRLDRCYWVCAFSVNQHASICGGYGPEPAPGPGWAAWDRKRYDSVSGERFPLCGCQEPKVFSHRDATCELNKFDDMMGFLSAESPSFSHLIVVDEQFEVLFRAWCVAEIVEANVQNIPARIKVFSQNVVDCNYDRLSLLDVRDCSASSQADKEVILQKILDVDAFNLRLQHLVFSSQGLFSKWVDGKERSRQVGRIWRRSSCNSGAWDEKEDLGSCCHFASMFSKFQSEGESETSSSDWA